MTLISIIIPTYNSDATLSQCLQSVLSQTNQDFEIIIVDGVSSDKTLELVDSYSAKVDYIKCISESDKGIYDAMNKGVNIASGEWIYFLGSDDYLFDSRVLYDIAQVLSYTAADLVYGNAIVTSDNSRKGGEFTLYKLLTEGNLCHQTIFYRKSIFNSIGGYNLSYPIISDWDYNIRCFQMLGQAKTLYVERDIVLFNDVTGISSVSRNDPFYKVIPAPYIWEIKSLEYKYKALLESREFKIGNTIYNVLKKFGIINIIKRIN